jgi:hypothetical protein
MAIQSEICVFPEEHSGLVLVLSLPVVAFDADNFSGSFQVLGNLPVRY